MTNILINRQAAGGDVLMTSPIIKKLYQEYNGNCNIDFSVWHECAPFIEKNPYIRNILKIKPSQDLISSYDRYVDLDSVYERNPNIHAVDAYALHTFGHTGFDRSLELHTSEEDKAVANTFSEIIGGNYVVLHQRRWAWPSRNINSDMWKQVAEKIISNTSAFIVQIGQPHEPCITGNDRIIDARGQFSIHELKEIIGNAKLFLGVDSAPSHVASATNTNMIVLYTSVREEFRRPLRTQGQFVPIATNIDCYGCHGKNPAPCTTFICNRGDVECVNRFDPQSIANQAISLLKN